MAVKFQHMDSGKVETTESFFFDQFMNARIDTGEDSNSGYDPILEVGRDGAWLERHWKEIKLNEMEYEEDVNQYKRTQVSHNVPISGQPRRAASGQSGAYQSFRNDFSKSKI